MSDSLISIPAIACRSKSIGCVHVGKDVLVVLHEHGEVRNVDIGVIVVVEIGDSDVHRVVRLGDPERWSRIFELSGAEVAKECVSAVVVGDDDVLAPIPIEVDV